MSPLPSRKALEAMKRVDIQKLCKDYGVKANLKTEALIDLLLEIDAPVPQPPASPTTTRTVSLRKSNRRGTNRIGSVIIYETDEEDEDEEAKTDRPSPKPSQPKPEVVLPPRTRKAKETQFRLGVGRPLAAGGSGARAVTKSVSVTKARHAKSSKAMKPTEATIREEEHEIEIETEIPQQPAADPSTSNTSNIRTGGSVALSPEVSSLSPVEIENRISDALRPFHEQLQSLKSELQQLQTQTESLQNKVDSLTSEMDGLRTQASEATNLKNELDQLKEELQLRSFGRPVPSTPPLRIPQRDAPGAPFEMNITTLSGVDLDAPDSSPSGSKTTQSKSKDSGHPGFAPSALGKRPRDSTTSNVTGIFEEGQQDMLSEEELTRKVARPMKKRPKVLLQEEATIQRVSAPSSPHPSSSTQEQQQSAEDSHCVPTFTVFNDPDSMADYSDPPPPTTHLPEFFEPPSPAGSGASSSRQPITSTAHESENQNPFTFSFLPTSHPPFIPAFPYPEPPQSPTPASNRRVGHVSQPPSSAERSDMLPALGLPRPPRPMSHGNSGSGQSDTAAFVNPTSLTRLPSDGGDVKSPDGQNTSSAHSESMAGQPPSNRTMYGTELDGDTRFGDFGVEGVATGFWAGGRF